MQESGRHPSRHGLMVEQLARPWEPGSTDVPFPCDCLPINLLGEQFWGRAARASRDSNGSGALVIFARISRERARENREATAFMGSRAETVLVGSGQSAVTANSCGLILGLGLNLLCASTTAMAVTLTMSSTSAPRGCT